MESFGYPASTLTTLGAYDNWGKQVLYCKTEGGSYYREVSDENGWRFERYANEVKSLDDFTTAFSLGYQFWSDDDGVVKACHFPAKNVIGSE